MTIRKFQSPLVGLKRFERQKEIRMNIGGEWKTFSYEHIFDLVNDLDKMLSGDLIEVSKMECGCYTREYAGDKAAEKRRQVNGR